MIIIVQLYSIYGQAKIFGQCLGNYIVPVHFRCHIWPVDFFFGSTVLAGIKRRCILGPIFGRPKIFVQCLGNYIVPVHFRFHIWPVDFCFGSTVLAGIKPRCILGPIFGRPKIFSQCLGNYIVPVYFRRRIWPGNFFWQHSPGQYIWHSRIPGVPGIRPARHTLPVPGMEVVGTLWCPYAC